MLVLCLLGNVPTDVLDSLRELEEDNALALQLACKTALESHVSDVIDQPRSERAVRGMADVLATTGAARRLDEFAKR